MLSRLLHHYRKSRELHRLTDEVRAAPDLAGKMNVLRRIRELQDDYDPEALPRWAESGVEWFVGNVLPLLAPCGNHVPNFLRRILLALRMR